jgi:hypothetical protein
MPLYQVRNATKEIIDVFEAVSPSNAACKAFNSVRRKTKITEMQCYVVTEGKRNMVAYLVKLVPLEKPNDHERKHNILMKTHAFKIEFI